MKNKTRKKQILSVMKRLSLLLEEKNDIFFAEREFLTDRGNILEVNECTERREENERKIEESYIEYTAIFSELAGEFPKEAQKPIQETIL
ncbi:MAG: hypothetical protein ACYC6W_11700 [Nitrosotalea sp.]